METKLNAALIFQSVNEIIIVLILVLLHTICFLNILQT